MASALRDEGRDHGAHAPERRGDAVREAEGALAGELPGQHLPQARSLCGGSTFMHAVYRPSAVLS